MSQFTDIEYTVEAPSALIRLNRPDQLNAFTRHTLREIREAVELAVKDVNVVGIIITGTGRAFSAGLDMTELAAATSADAPPAAAAEDVLPGIFSYLIETPKPVIAALNGVAAGGGLVLALMSDLRFAAETSSLTTVFVKRGLIAEHGTSWLLPRMVGVSRALDLLWMSDKITADEAASIGLVDRVTDGDPVHAARDYIGRLAETSAPKAIAASKSLVYRHLGTDYTQALQEAERVQNDFVTAPDAIEGAKSFIERRPPKFERIGSDSD
jgi:enoyl-CoA hydratase/carnithine racemase